LKTDFASWIITCFEKSSCKQRRGWGTISSVLEPVAAVCCAVGDQHMWSPVSHNQAVHLFDLGRFHVLLAVKLVPLCSPCLT
jgi:hypothetical protein